MRAVVVPSSFVLFAAGLAACGLAGCGGSDRGGRGYVVIVPRDGSTNTGERDGGEEGREDASDDPQRGDGSSEGWPDARETFEDAWSPPDAGGGVEDARGFPDASGFPDAFVPPDAGIADAGRPDSGGPRDGGFPDLGFPFPPQDAGRPDTGNSDSGVPPAFQTTVSIVTGSQITLNLVPPVAPDPLSYTAELGYDNIGPGSQNISIVNVNVNAIIVPVQDFVAGPAHNAPVGFSSQVVSKAAGTGTPLSSPSVLCQIPIAQVTIDFSNGQQLSDIAFVTCVQ